MTNDPTALIVVLAGLLIALAIAIVVMRKRSARRSAALRAHFGPEYDRALERHGDRAHAERELAARQRRVEKLDVHFLTDEQCDRFSAAWGEIQLRFVDDPSGAVQAADALVKDVMSARGYPMGNFEQRVADLSVEHAAVVDNYRAARTIACANAEGHAGTEELRRAMVHYRALFTDLLRTQVPYAALREAHV